MPALGQSSCQANVNFMDELHSWPLQQLTSLTEFKLLRDVHCSQSHVQKFNFSQGLELDDPADPTTMSATGQVRIWNPKHHPSQASTYSQISEVRLSPTTRLVSFAGQTATASDYADLLPSLGEQTRLALANVDKCLQAAGVSKDHLTSNRQYVVDLASLSPKDFQARADAFMEWWSSTQGDTLPPPDSLIGVDSLFKRGVLIEIEVTCVAPL